MYVTVWQASSSPPPGPEATYLGLTATAYHLVGLFGGMVLVLTSAFGAERWFHDSNPEASRQASRQLA
jgi:hypothetical protein